MTGEDLHSRLLAIDTASGRALTAFHGIGDTLNPVDVLVAARALRCAVAETSKLAHELDVDLRAMQALR